MTSQKQSAAHADRSVSAVSRGARAAHGVIRGINGFITFIEELVFLALLLFALYAIWDNQQIDNGTSASQYEMYKPSAEDTRTFEDFQKVNPDVCAWLTIDDTGIDYPLVHGEDNDQYMNTTPDLQFALSGSLFLDAASAPDFSDFDTIIYGHHMEGPSMFGELDQYADESFFQNHQTGRLYYDGVWHALNIYAYVTADAYDTNIYRTLPSPNSLGEDKTTGSGSDALDADGGSDEAGSAGGADAPGNINADAAQACTEYLSYIKDQSTHYREIGVTAADHIIVMSTCMTDQTNGRYLVIARIGQSVAAPQKETVTVRHSSSLLTQTSILEQEQYRKQTGKHIISLLLLALALLILRQILRHFRKKRIAAQEAQETGSM